MQVSIPSGSKDIQSRLKCLITENELVLEEKGVDSYSMQTSLNVAFATNYVGSPMAAYTQACMCSQMKPSSPWTKMTGS
jgi:hypothetical protein